MITQVAYIALGVVAGIAGGFFGIGGATILIPAMVYFFGLTQHQAQGTSLAVMVFPIGLLAALRYYQDGHVKLGMAGFICVGFFVGALLGAHAAQYAAAPVLKKIFGVFLLMVALRMIIW